jgi:antitoxin component YwqK of YwqJK toxin-antitoxin module/Tfp pilus assembly protein PilF
MMHRNLKQALLFACLFCLQFCAFAQEPAPLVNSGDVLRKGSKLHDDRQYKEALRLYQTISRSDTNYSTALHELAYTCYADSQFEASYAYAAKGLELFPAKQSDWYGLMANACDELNRNSEALRLYDKAIEYNPHSYTAVFNKGICYYKMKKFAEAKQQMQQTLLIYPYYSSAHYYLGAISYEEGQMVPALMSFAMALAVNPENRYLKNTITYMSSIAQVKDETQAKINARKSAATFELIEEILASKIALDAKYTLKTSVQDAITRQLQVIFEKLEYDAASKDFWMQFYVPCYQQIFSGKQYNDFCHLICSGLSIKQVDSYVKSHKKEIAAVNEAVSTYLENIRETRVLSYTQRAAVRQRYIYADGRMSGKGEWTTQGKNTVLSGPWVFYHTNGNLRSKGTLSSTQEKEGEWQFMNTDGTPESVTFYSRNKANGKSISYYRNGLPETEEHYVNGIPDGEKKTYYFNGFPRLAEYYTNGKRNGAVKGYAADGSLRFTGNYQNDELEGLLTYYHPNGKVASTCTYRNGKADGVFKKYDEEGNRIEEGTYVLDKAEGVWKTYFAGNRLSKDQIYRNDKLNGLSTEYYENGTKMDAGYYTDGEPDGADSSFTEEGKLHCITIFEKKRLKEITFYDETGKLISSATTRKGAGNLVFYDSHGNKTSEGYFSKDGQREGKTTYYHPNGTVSITATYQNGKLEGERTEYFANGKLASTLNYTNDEADGYFTSYYANGRKKEEGWYVLGQKQGPHTSYNALGDKTRTIYYLNDEENGYTEYFYPNGKLDYEQLFKAGWVNQVTQFDTTGKALTNCRLEKGEAPWTFLHYNGKPYISGQYSNYHFHGKYDVFFFDGSPQTISYFNKGQRDSLFQSFYYGGRLASEGAYRNGDKTGLWKYYYANGQLRFREQYVNGKEEGVEDLYDEDGKTLRSITYHKGEREGAYRFFGETGQLGLQIRYHHDRPVSYTYEGSDGKLLPEKKIVNATGKITGYYSNGNKSVEIEFLNGELHGARNTYFTNGKPRTTSTEVLDQTEGPLKVYALNGQLLKEENYQTGNLHGLARQYYPNGRLKTEEQWYNGDLHGTCKYYDATGKLTRTREYYYDILQSVK